ncbi:MAG: hypothetical protein E7661_10000 [Ruminococcaceae bacterium]|nr:hypothetical protein [Oscillospiraceae bacterium]
MKLSLRGFLCLCLACLTLWLSACSMYGDRKVADRQYLERRKEILTSHRLTGSEEFTVYAAVIDLDEGTHVSSVACLSDGTASLYLSTGEAYEQVSLDRPEIASAVVAFLKGMGEHLDLATRQARTDLALPSKGQDLLYLLTDKGIYTLTVIPEYIPESTEAAQEIYALYRAVYDGVCASIPKEDQSISAETAP